MPNSRLAPYLLCSLLALHSRADIASDIGELLKKGDAKAALDRSDEALSKTPRDARVRFLRGIALAEQARTPEAIQVFQALTQDHPEMPEPYNNLAVLYAQQGELDKARAALQKAIQTNPAYATAQANLADVYGKLASQAYDKALPVDKNAPAVTPAPAKLALVKDLYVGTRSNTVVAASTPPSKPVTPPSVAAVTAPAKPQPITVAPSKVAPVAPSTPIQIAAVTPKAEPAKAAVAQPAPPPKAVEVKPASPPPAPAKPAPVPAAPAKAPEVKAAEVKAPNLKPAEAKPVPAPVHPSASQEEEEQITKALHNWAEAWSSKHVGAYLGFYAKGFKPPQGLSRTAWEKQRRERVDAAKKIDVKLSNIKIKLEGDMATVRLVQRYRSDRMDSSTGKTFVLEHVGGHWLIREERVG